MTTIESLLPDLRPALLRAARHRLRNAHWAEDAVSETLLAALQRNPGFSDPERLRAWLFGILRHKVTDQLRLHLGEVAAPAPLEMDDEVHAEIVDPSPQADPMRRLADTQFIRALQGQLERLPGTHARAFVLRECLGIDTTQICDELAITAGNLWVMLHRTRQRLRQGLSAYQT